MSNDQIQATIPSDDVRERCRNTSTEELLTAAMEVHSRSVMYGTREQHEAAQAYKDEILRRVNAQQAEIARLLAIVNMPQSNDFLRAVSTEAEHQRQRWPSDHDAGKTTADWFWLVGYLAGKALHAAMVGDIKKAEHHIITTAAALANWHLALMGKTNMRPGLSQDATQNYDTDKVGHNGD